MLGATADEAPLSYGDPQKRPDRTFRWTAIADHSVALKVVGGLDMDDLVVQVFAESTCASASSVSCNNDRTASVRRPEVDFQGRPARRTSSSSRRSERRLRVASTCCRRLSGRPFAKVPTGPRAPLLNPRAPGSDPR